MEDGKIVVMTEDQLKKFVEDCGKKASAATIKAMHDAEKAARRVRKDRRLHNTDLLLRNYHMFKLSFDESAVTVRQLEEEQSVNEILNLMMNRDSDELTIESIKRSKARTAVILNHIDTMLEIYRMFCERSSDELDLRRYDVLVSRYIMDPPLSVKEISNKYHMSKESVYKDLCITKERVSALLFGVDGIQLSAK